MAKEKNKTEIPQVLEGELRAHLIKLREDAGYSTVQMAEALCLSEEVILNLENEAFELLAEPPYVRGYLRNYAKLGEADPSELINRYEALRGADASELDYQIKASSHIDTFSRKGLSPVIAQLILLALLLLGIGLLTMIPAVNQWVKSTWESISNQLQTQSSESINNPLLTGTMPVPIPLPESEESSTDNPEAFATQNPGIENAPQTKPQTEENTAKPANNSSNIASIPAPSTTTEIDTKTPETIPETTTEKPRPVAEVTQETSNPNAPINIKLIFNKDVWLRIKNKDNKTVFEGLNKTGTDKALELEKPLTFRVGNAQGLSLFVDDKAVDISKYINGSIANFTLE